MSKFTDRIKSMFGFKTDEEKLKEALQVEINNMNSFFKNQDMNGFIDYSKQFDYIENKEISHAERDIDTEIRYNLYETMKENFGERKWKSMMKDNRFKDMLTKETKNLTEKAIVNMYGKESFEDKLFKPSYKIGDLQEIQNEKTLQYKKEDKPKEEIKVYKGIPNLKDIKKQNKLPDLDTLNNKSKGLPDLKTLNLKTSKKDQKVINNINKKATAQKIIKDDVKYITGIIQNNEEARDNKTFMNIADEYIKESLGVRFSDAIKNKYMSDVIVSEFYTPDKDMINIINKALNEKSLSAEQDKRYKDLTGVSFYKSEHNKDNARALVAVARDSLDTPFKEHIENESKKAYTLHIQNKCQEVLNEKGLGLMSPSTEKIDMTVSSKPKLKLPDLDTLDDKEKPLDSLIDDAINQVEKDTRNKDEQVKDKEREDGER